MNELEITSEKLKFDLKIPIKINIPKYKNIII